MKTKTRTTIRTAFGTALIAATLALAGIAHGQGPQSASAPPPSSWHRFTSNDYGFSVALPGQPTEETTPGKSGRASLHRFYTSLGGETLYMVQVGEPPVSGRARYAVPEDIAQRYAEGSGATIEKQHTLSFAGQPAREAMFHDPRTDMEHHVIWIVANNRTYLIAAAGPRAFVESSGTRRFFDSFRLALNL